MDIYKLRLIALCYLVICISCEEKTNYLTKNSTKVWFRNFSRNIFPQNPYCSICCIDTRKKTLAKICGKHTMCIYRGGMNGPGCKGFLDIPLDGDEIEVILDAHNTIRNKVALGREERGNPGPQPTASDMRVVEWNADLALIAYRWASQCVFAYDLCRDIPEFPVGQNIARGNFATNHDLSFIANWFSYVQYISENDITSFQLSLNNPLRQYTQLVWAETYQIGCARVLFQQSSVSGNTSYYEHFICNYGPTGNIVGQPVYKIGKPCSNCPEGTGCAVFYSGLCGNEIDFNLLRKLNPPKKNIFGKNRLRINFCERLIPGRELCYFYVVIFFIIFY